MTADEPGPDAVKVRRISPEDAGGWRALRLAALAEEPTAFTRTVTEDAALPLDVWHQRALAGGAGSQSAVFLALTDRPVGMIMGVDAGVGSTKILSMYVAPSHRGSGLVDRLVAAVAGWSREAGRGELVLEVSDVNARALAAYARLGFRPTGHSSLHPLYRQVSLIEMRMGLG